MRGSAHTRSQRRQASDMDFVSFPRTDSAVSKRRTVSWVKRQKKNCSSPASTNQDRAFSECACRPQIKASHTFESGKFNVFIDLFVGEIDLGAAGNNQRKLHSPRAWALPLKKYDANAGENEFAHGAPIRGSLLFELTIKRRGNIDRGANGILLHEGIMACVP